MEIFLEMGGKKIVGEKINKLFKHDSYFISLIEKSINTNRNINEFNVLISTPKKQTTVSISISKIENKYQGWSGYCGFSKPR